MSSQLVENLRQLLGNDNAQRVAAEQQYQAMKKGQPAVLIRAFLEVLSQPQVEQAVREQAAVLLRQCLTQVTEVGSAWSQVGGSQNDVKAKLLQLLEAEPIEPVRKKVADCVQALGNQLITVEAEGTTNITGWPELLPLLMQLACDMGKDAGIRADALWILSEMAGSIWQLLLANGGQTFHVLKGSLLGQADSVRANAVALLCSLVESLSCKDERKQFASLIPDLCSAIAQLAACSDSKHLNAALQAVGSAADHADFFKDSVASHILPLMTGIAKTHNDPDARRAGMEVLISLAEAKPKAMLKVPTFLQQILDVCVFFIMEIGDDIQEWSIAEETDEIDGEEQQEYGLVVVNRLSESMNNVESFAQVLSVMQPAIVQLFQRGEWKSIATGLSLLAQIAEYVDEEATVAQMLQAVMGQLRSEHPRVRYCAWIAIMQFSIDRKEVVANDSNIGPILDAISVGLDDPCQRVAIATMMAMHHFCQAVDREDLEPRLPELMQKLGAKLQAGDGAQQEAILCVSVIAQTTEDGFAHYYPQLMPHLTQVIGSSVQKVEKRELLGRALDCISILANVVGKEVFRADVVAIMSAMAQLTKAEGVPKNDPVQEYIMSAAQRICSTMKEDFSPFLPDLLPLILGKFAFTPKLVRGEEDIENNDDDVSLAIVHEGGEAKMLAMNSSEMEELEGALRCIYTFAEKLGKNYGPFIPQTALSLVPIFDFQMCEVVRDLAFESWGQLCHCARQGNESAMLMQLVQQLMQRLIPKLEAPDEPLDAQVTRIEGMMRCLEKAGPGILSMEQICQLCQLIAKLLGESFVRKEQEVLRKSKPVAADDDDESTVDEDIEEKMRNALCTLLRMGVIQHNPDAFVAEGLGIYLPLVQRLIQPSVNADDRRLAIILAQSFLEYLGDKVVAQWETFLPQILQGICDKEAEFRGASCYAVSLAAKQQAFGPFVVETAGRLKDLIEQTRSLSKKKSDMVAQTAADNAVSALMEMLMNHAGVLGEVATPLWSVWLSGLPCQGDDDEGIRNHRVLLQALQQQKTEVLGKGGANLPRVLAILVDVYKTDMADEDLSQSIGKTLLSIGETGIAQYASTLKGKQQKKLQRIMREASQ